MKRITLERTFDSPIEDVWELWTTKEGIESWWGPDGMHVEVRSIDVRPGGEMRYAMVADGADQRAFLKQAGMPAVLEHSLRYTEVVERRRLVWVHDVDFVPGVAHYEMRHELELHPTEGGVRMVVTFDAMHDDVWTGHAIAGFEMELGKLARRLETLAARRR
jgi:uncharacterized protein YndB with AHSA1/START domain